MVHQPFTICNSWFYSLIYLILYSRQAVQPNRLQHRHSGALSDNGQKYEFYIRLWHKTFRCTGPIQQKQVAHSHKRLKLSGVIQSYSVILSIASAAPEFADTLFTGTNIKIFFLQSSYINLFYTLIQDIFIHFTTTIALSLHLVRALLVLQNRIFPPFVAFRVPSKHIPL